MGDSAMHFEILIEDASGKIGLDALVPKIIGPDHTFRIHSYRGIGRIPQGLKTTADPQKRILLDQLPKLIRGYGATLAAYPHKSVALIVVCDLDRQCLSAFRKELLALVATCEPRPDTYFCLAVEEGEAWYLGDIAAIKKAYPHAKDAVLRAYVNDSICGTWEKLADAIFPGGSRALQKQGGQTAGKEKAAWATRIPPHMDIDENLSPSFCYFRDKLRRLIDG
jgi:hypothetical protein